MSEINIVTQSVSFEADGAVVSAYRQAAPAEPGSEPREQWVFHTAQILANGGISPDPDSGVPQQIVVDSVEERDRVGKALLQKQVTFRKRIEEAANSFRDEFGASIQEVAAGAPAAAEKPDETF